MAQVRWSTVARRQFQAIVRYVADDSLSAATALAAQFRAASIRVVSFPRLGRMVPEFQQPAIREVIVGQYRLIYRVDGETVVILTVIHGSRDLLRQMPGGPWDIE